MFRKSLRFIHRHNKVAFILVMDVIAVTLTLRDLFFGIPLIAEAYVGRYFKFLESAHRFRTKIRFRMPRLGLMKRRFNFIESKFMYRSNMAIFLDMAFKKNAEGDLVFKRDEKLKVISVIASLKQAGYFDKVSSVTGHMLITLNTAQRFDLSREEVSASIAAFTEDTLGPVGYLSKKELAHSAVQLLSGKL